MSKADVRRWGAGVLAAALLGACTGPGSAVRGDTGGPGAATGELGAAGAGPAQISTRALLKFEDAVKLMQAQEKAGTYDWVALERRFQDALGEDQNLAEAEYNLGIIAEKQGKSQDAARYYRNALGKKPSLTVAGHNLAILQLRGGDAAAAGETYRQVLERMPDDARSYAGLAELSRQAGDCDQALKYARAALVREPLTMAASKVMMKCHLERKDLAMARLVAQRALKLDAKDPEILMVVGEIFSAEGEHEKARVQFAAAAEAAPDFVPAQLKLAQLALASQNWPTAETHLRRLLQVDGNNAEAHLNLGVAYRGMGQPDKAMQEYDLAEKLNPQLAPIYLNRAIILHRVKNAPDRALELYRKYVAMAGGEFAVASDSPVYGLIQECEQIIVANAEAARMEAAQAQQPAEGEAPVDAAPSDAPPAAAPVDAEPQGDPFAEEPQG